MRECWFGGLSRTVGHRCDATHVPRRLIYVTRLRIRYYGTHADSAASSDLSFWQIERTRPPNHEGTLESPRAVTVAPYKRPLFIDAGERPRPRWVHFAEGPGHSLASFRRARGCKLKSALSSYPQILMSSGRCRGARTPSFAGERRESTDPRSGQAHTNPARQRGPASCHTNPTRQRGGRANASAKPSLPSLPRPDHAFSGRRISIAPASANPPLSPLPVPAWETR
jgi:hypothetical protein